MVLSCQFFFFFNDTATTEIYTLSLHDALPICRHDRRDRGVAGNEERHHPDDRADAADERRDAEKGAAARRDHLPAAGELEEQRPGMPEHRRSPGKHAGERRYGVEEHERRDESLRGVEQDDGDPVRTAVRPPDIRRADVAAPVAPDVLVLQRVHEPVPGRDRTGEVANEECERDAYFVGIWYLETQSFTADQSRLSKNASMYDARSVWKSMKYACS